MPDRFEVELVPNPRKEIRAKYREVFTSPLGMQVLQDILTMAEFGTIIHPTNEVRLMWHNAAVCILHECGMVGPKLMDQVVRAFCNVIPEDG